MQMMVPRRTAICQAGRTGAGAVDGGSGGAPGPASRLAARRSCTPWIRGSGLRQWLDAVPAGECGLCFEALRCVASLVGPCRRRPEALVVK